MNDLFIIMNTAIELHGQGRLEEAEEIYRRVLKIKPDHADAMNLLGVIYQARGKYDEAIEILGKAIINSPHVADYHSNMAAAQLAKGLPASAIHHASRACTLDPDLGKAHHNMGNGLFALGRANEAVRSFVKAIETDPSNDLFWSNYLYALNFATSASKEFVFEENSRWGTSQEKLYTVDTHFNNDTSHGRPLRLAYFIPEFDQHVTIRFLEPILRHHNREKFKIFIYGYATDNHLLPKLPGDQTDKWVDVSNKGVESVAKLIRLDEIDILLHPCTYKARYRKLIAYNPAPIQIACINLVSTTGLRRATHLITDKFLSPPDEGTRFFTEKLIRLSSFNVYRIPEKMPEVKPLPALKNDHFVFGSFNNPAKLTQESLAVWSKVLRKIPSSKLLLKHRTLENLEVCEVFIRKFSEEGVLDDRLIFRGYTHDTVEYLNCYNEIDLALDPLPFGGGTTTYEAIMMGVPVLTIAGNTIMGRLTGSIMTRLGYSNLVTTSPEEFVSTAQDITLDLPRLSVVRDNLRERATQSVFNSQHFTRELEDACQVIWNNYCDKND